jgi:hypothetical protein
MILGPAVRFGEQVDDRRLARFAFAVRKYAKRQQHQQQGEIDPQREREPRRAPLERRTVVRGGEPVGRQGRLRIRQSGVARTTRIDGPRLNGE